MTRGSDRLTSVLAAILVILVVGLGTDTEMVSGATDHGRERATNSLTTQFPLGRQRLCCTAKPAHRAASPSRPQPAVSRTTPASSSTASAPPPRARTSSHSPLLVGRGGDAAAPLIVIGVVIVGGLAGAALCRVLVRRRRRARRSARAVTATAVAGPTAHSSAAETAVAQPTGHSSEAAAAVVAPAGHRPEATPPRPARTRTDVRSRAGPEPPVDLPPAIAAASIPGAGDEETVADPLARLEREILERGAAASAAAAARRSRSGEGAYRLGKILYERGRLDEAAAAWRLAASKQHARAAARLAELLEQRHDA